MLHLFRKLFHAPKGKLSQMKALEDKKREMEMKLQLLQEIETELKNKS